MKKEMKAIFEQELKKAWNDEKMVKFCMKQAACVIEHNGYLYEIEKPKMKKDFCFGHGLFGISTDEECRDAENMAELARSSVKYFVEKNLEPVDRQIEHLENIKSEMGKNWAEGSRPLYMLETGAHYTGQATDCRLKYWCEVNTFGRAGSGELCEDVELVQKLIDGFKETRQEFLSRVV